MEQELFHRFIRRTDNIGQVISASDINALQEVLEAIQKEMFRLRDRDFLDNAIFILENHPEFNRLLVENFNNQNKIDYTASRNIAYIEEETAISINRESDALEAVYESVFWQIPVSKVMLLVSDYQPEGSSIEYYISTQYGIWEPIVSSQIKEVTGSFVKIRATIRRSNPDIHPTINNWALLIKDPSIIETADLP